LVEVLVDALHPHLTTPFAFFGHSMGALISFELTRLLRREGIAGPRYLFVSARRAPQLRDDNPLLHDQPECILVEQLTSRYNSIPKTIVDDAELREMFLPMLRADLAVCETYQYVQEEPLDCPISASGGIDDRQVSQIDLEEWRDQTKADFSLRMFPGDHFFLKSSQKQLLRALTDDLARVSHYPSTVTTVPEKHGQDIRYGSTKRT
jgi:medium-chain acyl-[acyl-carrier-protein] hydrolase